MTAAIFMIGAYTVGMLGLLALLGVMLFVRAGVRAWLQYRNRYQFPRVRIVACPPRVAAQWEQMFGRIYPR